ncbi:hypothetical protein [Oceanobacillus sp. CAU 1775]
MDTFLFALYTILYIALLVWGISKSPRGNFWSLRTFLFLVLIGLIYDNSIMALGKFIGEGDLLETLNLLRYWSHGLFTPTLVLFSLGVLQAGDTKWAKTKIAYYSAIIFTGILIFIEFRTQIIGLELEAVWEYGVLRYTEVDPSGGPPIMILLITAALLIAGLILWITSGWAWMFVGAIIMTIGSVVPIPLESEASTNGFELILLTSLLLTKIHMEK